MRYYITDSNYIPIGFQNKDGYSILKAIDRLQKEVRECVHMFGGKPEDYKSCYHIVDTDFNTIIEYDNYIR